MEFSISFHTKNNVYKFFLVQNLRRILIALCGILALFIAPLRLLFLKVNQKNGGRDFERDLRVLFLVPQGFNISDPKNNNLNGSTKVNESIVELLKEMKIRYEIECVSKTFLASVYQLIKVTRNAKRILYCHKVLISIPGSSGYLATFLSVICRKDVIFLSHNAELFHRRDWIRNIKGIRRKILYAFKAVNGFVSDLLVANSNCDVLVLGEREIELYWNRIKLRKFDLKSVHYFPYIPPKRLRFSKSETSRINVAIVGTFAPNIGENRGNNSFFISLNPITKILNKVGLDLITIGHGNEYASRVCKKNYGFVDDKAYLALNSKICAILVPSDWGWGFKTKIADAIFANQRVYLPRTLGERYPSWAQALFLIDSWNDFVWVKMSKKERDIRNMVKRKQIKLRREIAAHIL